MIDEKATGMTTERLIERLREAAKSPARYRLIIHKLLSWAADELESAKPKEPGDLKLGSRLTVEGVEAVVVPVEPTETMAFCTGIVTPSEAAKVYRAMLSAAGERA